MNIVPFHLAFPVKDLQATYDFYSELLGCKIGRTSERWIDFNLFGHQLSAHLKPEETVAAPNVPVRHFGAILPWNEWHILAGRLKAAQIKFVIEPYIRFKGQPGEQATMFFYDPSGNALEFKSFKDQAKIFATE